MNYKNKVPEVRSIRIQFSRDSDFQCVEPKGATIGNFNPEGTVVLSLAIQRLGSMSLSALAGWKSALGEKYGTEILIYYHLSSISE